MKKKVLVVLLALFVLIAVGCGMDSADSSDGIPFEQYEITDSNGCEYVVVYAEEKFGSSHPIAISIASKVKQPEGCN